jgi:DNA end-binding protein Ku
MAGRAIWRAHLQLGKTAIPVKLYSAIEDRGIHFRLLHARDHAPVVQRMVDPTTGAEVARERMQKGAAVGGGRFVILHPDELARVEPEDSRAIVVERTVPAGALDHAFYDRPYWVGPDGQDARYWALAAALRDEKVEGIARWVMRKRTYAGALRARDGRLVLVTLRHAGEVVEPGEVQAPRGRPPDPKELQMARQLVGMLEGPFEPEAYRDEYRDRVLDLVRRKQRGQKIPRPRRAPKRAVPTLAQALQRSIGAARSRGARPARRSHG